MKAAILAGLEAATEDDLPGMADAIQRLLAHGYGGLYMACTAWAHAVKVFGHLPGSGRAALRLVDATSGDTLEPAEFPAEYAPALWAGRFVTAYLNGDTATMSALYRAVDGEELGAGAVYLLRFAGWAVAHSEQCR